jgi:nucleoside-diphosphate kinase
MAIEQTLSLIKPDGVSRGLIGEVIGRFENAVLKIRALKMVHLSLEQARAFYAVHQERPFFDSLTRFMSSGPIVAMILEGDNAIQVNRDLMGATDYRQAAPGTIRADFAKDIEANPPV